MLMKSLEGMKDRLQEIIRYKTGGHQTKFATLMGWSPQYLAKLLKGDNFGIQPVKSLLEAMPEINARWLLFGEGQMLEVSQLFTLQREVFSHAQALLELEKYIPYMSPEEMADFEHALSGGRLPSYSPDTLTKWQRLITERKEFIDAKFSQATAKSEEICRQQTAKK